MKHQIRKSLFHVPTEDGIPMKPEETNLNLRSQTSIGEMLARGNLAKHFRRSNQLLASDRKENESKKVTRTYKNDLLFNLNIYNSLGVD